MLRLPEMYGCILGFQRLTRWPKWTPASTNDLTNSAGAVAMTELLRINGNMPAADATSEGQDHSGRIRAYKGQRGCKTMTRVPSPAEMPVCVNARASWRGKRTTVTPGGG